LKTPSVSTSGIRFKYNIEAPDSVIISAGNQYNIYPDEWIKDSITNNSIKYKIVKYTVIPYTLNGNLIEKCEGDTNIFYVYINPTPVMQVTTPYLSDANDTVYCDSSTVTFNLKSLNGTILGEKYYKMFTFYNKSNIKVIGDTIANKLIGNFSNTLINLSDSIQYVSYRFIPIFPRGADTCSVGKIVEINRYVLPALKVTLIDTFYAGGYNNNIKCHGFSDGQITAVVKGGFTVPPYSQSQDNCTYLWHPANKDKRIISGLKAGYYSVNITDRHSCKTFAKDTLFEPYPLLVAIQDSQDFKCSSATKGILIGSHTGGTAPFSPFWHEPNGNTINDTAFNLTEGLQIYQVTDANKCFNSTFFDMESVYVPIDLNASCYDTCKFTSNCCKYNISCTGKNDGFFHPDLSDNHDSLFYEWHYFKTINDTIIDTIIQRTKGSGDITNLLAGDYSLVVINSALGCKNPQIEFALLEPKPLTIQETISSYYQGQYNISCDNNNDGSITLTESGGHGNFRYIWNSNGPVIANPYNHDQINLDSGAYFVKVIDSSFTEFADVHGALKYCYAFDTFHLVKPPFLKLNAILSDYHGFNISCIGSEDGFIHSNLVGEFNGFKPYKYYWQKDGTDLNFSDTSSFANRLSAGIYNLKVSYGYDCEKDSNIKLNHEPDSIKIIDNLSNYNGKNLLCFGDSSGHDSLTVNGGTGTYFWYFNNDTNNTYAISNFPVNLKASTYVLVIEDINKCKEFDTISLKSPDKLESYAFGKNLTCYNANNGWAYDSVSGGIEPYIYLWSTSETTDTIYHLSEKEYSVITFDKNGCSDTTSVTLSEPGNLTVTLQKDTLYNGRDISCFKGSDGKISVIVTGGTRPYTYYWNMSPSNSDTVFSGLPFGNYKVLVIDVDTCRGKDSIKLKQPPKLTIDIKKKDITCYDSINGKATVIINGGTHPYTYRWTDGQSDSLALKIKPGIDSVYVQDVNGCAIDSAINIKRPDALKAKQLDVKMPYCPDTPDGIIKVTAEGGTLPYLFNWSNRVSGTELDTLHQGEYILTLTDSNSCQMIDTFVLKAAHGACLDIPKAFSPNGDGLNDTWNILAGNPNSPKSLGDLYPNVVIDVYNRWGELIYKSERGYKHEWNGTSKGRVLPMDSYYYSIDLGNGNEKFVGIISIIR